MKFQLEKGKLTLGARSAERGEARIQLSVEYAGEKIETGFNPEFILDMLKVLGSETVKMELKEGDRPGLLRVGTDYQYVVMPVTPAQPA